MAAEQRRLLVCNACGAPLRPSNAREVRCEYCDAPATLPLDVSRLIDRLRTAAFDRQIQGEVAHAELVQAGAHWPVLRRVWIPLAVVLLIPVAVAALARVSSHDGLIAAAVGIVPAVGFALVTDRRVAGRARRLILGARGELEQAAPLPPAGQATCPHCGGHLPAPQGASGLCPSCGAESFPLRTAASAAEAAAWRESRRAELGRVAAEYIDKDVQSNARLHALGAVAGAILLTVLWGAHQRAAEARQRELEHAQRVRKMESTTVQLPEFSSSLLELAEALGNGTDETPAVLDLWRECVCPDIFLRRRLRSAEDRATMRRAILSTRDAPWHPSWMYGTVREVNGWKLYADCSGTSCCLHAVDVPEGGRSLY